MCNKREIFISTAKRYLGIEKGSVQHHEFIDIYNAYSGKPRGYTVTYNDNWCATFVSAVACLAEIEDLIPLECSCYYMRENAKARGIYRESAIFLAGEGDIILYDWEGDSVPNHVGIVISANDDYMTVIEGNKTENGKSVVGTRIISYDDDRICGYIEPKFEDDESYDYENLGWNKDGKGWWYAYGHKKGEYHVNNAVRIDNDLYFFDTEGYCVHPESIETTEKGAMKYIHGRRVD